MVKAAPNESGFSYISLEEHLLKTSRLYITDKRRESFIVWLLTVFLGLLLTSNSMMESTKVVSNANSVFARNVNSILSKEDGNVFFSPLSLHSILSLAYQGAGGETAKALSSTLSVSVKDASEGYKSLMEALNNASNITLDIANKVYLKSGYKLKASFDNVARKQFFSEVEQVEFSQNVAAAKTINAWVEEKTHQKIKDLIQPDSLDDLTRLVLVNAIYFKGNWAIPFRKESTHKEPFYLNAEDTVDVDMMHLTKKFQYGENQQLDAKIIELPYQNRQFSMLIILPNDVNGIKKLEQKLSTTDISTISQSLRNTEVILSLPRFKIETTMDLNDPLKELGLGVMFSNEADFSGMLDSPEALKVSQVVQKAFIEVNEEGAEAAAATGLQLRRKRAYEKFEFIANHPFVFALCFKEIHSDITSHETVLFLGKLIKPSDSPVSHTEL